MLGCSRPKEPRWPVHLSSSAPASARGKLKTIAEEARLEDEGFIRHVAGRLKHGGLDRVSLVHGSPKDNKAKAFDALLWGLHNLYLVDELEEDFTLKENLAATEAGLLVEKTELKNTCRQRDVAREKLEKAFVELKKVKDRVAILEHEVGEVPSLKEEVARFKNSVASILEVVDRERKEAVMVFQDFEEFLALKKEAHDADFKEGYSNNFRTLSVRGWVTKEKYFANMAWEKEEKRQREESSGGVGSDDVINLEDAEDKEGEQAVDEEEILCTPLRLSDQAVNGEGALPGLKLNGDPFTPGVILATGGAPEV